MNPTSAHDAPSSVDRTPERQVTLNGSDFYQPAVRLFARCGPTVVLRDLVALFRVLAVADAAAILLHEWEHACFVPAMPSVAVGLDEHWLQRQGLEALQEIAGHAQAAHDLVTVAARDLEFPTLAGGRRTLEACALPLEVEGAVVGVLIACYGQQPGRVDGALLRAFATVAGVAIENARLYARLEDVTTLRERDRIARDLHDGIIQDIYAGVLQLENLAEDLQDARARDQLHGMADHFSRVIGDVRTYIQGLSVRELDGHLLGERIAVLVGEVNGRGALLVAYTTDGEPYRLPGALATTLLLIAGEALSNVVKHAEASCAQVHLSYGAQVVTLSIADDGRGFDPALAIGEEHRGLRNLRARMDDVGGAFNLQHVTEGTMVIVSVPRPG